MLPPLPPPTPPDEEPKYSYGTDQAVMMLEALYKTVPDPHDNLLINLATIIRNCTDKDTVFKDAVTAVERVVNQITEVLTASMKMAKGIRGPRLIYYLADYNTEIPPMVHRNTTEYRELLQKLTRHFMRDIAHAKDIMLNDVLVKRVALPDGIASFSSLRSEIRNPINTNSIYMVSHCAIDYHICEHYPAFQLVESYTGNVLDKQQLGNKVFKQIDIPFCRSTHILLGDKDYIKSLLGIVEKRKIYALANSERWGLHTEDFIVNSLSRNGFSLPFKFR